MKLNYLYSKMAVLRFMLGLTEYVVSWITRSVGDRVQISDWSFTQ
jgi:hypothetical protein